MSVLPPRFLDPSLWLGLQVDTFYVVYADGQLHPRSTDSADAVYQPAGCIPEFIFCRISDSEKRLEHALESRLAVGGSWGALYEVLGQGSVIGTALSVRTSAFSSTHVLPDMVHLVCMVDDVPHDSVMKALYDFKTFRSFRLGPMTDDDHPHDLLVTTKARWFRNRNNPKFLGFSKDDKL